MSQDISVYSLRITEKKELLAAYMPFVKNGAIFLKAAQHPMGSSVCVVLEIPQEDKKYAFTGKVVWVVKKSNRLEGGVGVQFQEDSEGVQLKNRIDTVLAGLDRLKEKTMTV